MMNMVKRENRRLLIFKMIEIAKNSRIFPAIVIMLLIAYSAYWLFVSADPFWCNAIGNYNIVYLCFLIVLSFLSLVLLINQNRKWYFILSAISFIPAVIVCFINRFSRYPDYAAMLSQYYTDNQDEPVAQYMSAIYNADWKMYHYIIVRSGQSSTVVTVLVCLWIATMIIPHLKE